MPPLFPDEQPLAEHLSRSDVMNLLGTFSRHGFLLEELEWPSVEHYYQAMKFVDADYRERIRQAEHPRQARKLGRNRWKKRRHDWTQVKVTIMTRGVYTKCRTHPAIAEALLATGSATLVENSNYDYFWGCGRDRRGANMYGKVLMNVREKLREERAAANAGD
jgi:ribA/ribD-fused uncharacterized protein